jgi:hypothetical protein
MKETKILIFLISVTLLIGEAGFVSNKESLAKPPPPPGPFECCWKFRPEPNPHPKIYQINNLFPHAAQNKLKVLVKLESDLSQESKQIDVRVKAYIYKSAVINLDEGVASKVYVPDYAQKNVSAKKGDYFLLIPVNAYRRVDKYMYDFVKIPAELFR